MIDLNFEENQLIDGMPATAYYSLNAVNRGVLEEIRKSPAHAKAYLDAGSDCTPAMEFGSAFHIFALQPELFEDEVAIVKSRPQDKSKRPANKILVTEKEMALLTEMRDALYAKEVEMAGALIKIKDLLAHAKVEQTALWRDLGTGLFCKARFDVMFNNSIIDLKTCADAFDFSRAAFNCGYHRQASFYLSGARAVGLSVADFYFLVIEKDTPYGIRLFKASDAFLERGMEECTQNLALYADALADDKWQDYPSSAETLDLPRWA